MSLRLAVIGARGQVALALQGLAAPEIDVVTLGRPDLDLTARETVLPALRRVAPNLIVNAAGYTAVDKAESEPEAAFAVNQAGAEAVAEAAAVLATPVIHLSTDYVFDGRKGAPYLETDAPAPLNVYGASKLAGERAVLLAQPRCAIVRVSWIHSAHGTNFVRTMLSLATTSDEVSVVSDQVGRPMAAAAIADALVTIARNLVATPLPAHFGLFHLGGEGVANWADLAEATFEASAKLGGPRARVRRITTAEYRAAATRPLYTVMDGAKLKAAHGVSLPNWRDGVTKTVVGCLKQ